MNNVKMYATSTCPYCKAAREYMKENGITFQEVNVSDDPVMANEMVKKSGQMGVPVIEIDGHVIVGWNQQAIDLVLQKVEKGKSAV